MKVTGLKVQKILPWKDESKFTSDSGEVLTIPANQKFVCKDGEDFVNLTVQTSAPLPTVKVGDSLSIELRGFSRTSFSINVKGVLV